MNVNLPWTEFKNIVNSKVLSMQYSTKNNYYVIWAGENGTIYECEVAIETPTPDGSDQKDFEDNYKGTCNRPMHPVTADGKSYTRAESRPLDTTTYFTMQGDYGYAGDSDFAIGGGTVLEWDAGADQDFQAIDSNFKRKVITFTFGDSVWVKEGAIYFHNAAKGSYLDFYSFCPPGGYYLGNDGSVKQAADHTLIDHFVIHHKFQGTCQMGDELNTECCSDEIPYYIYHQLWITVPISDEQSNGYVCLELYRARTVIK